MRPIGKSPEPGPSCWSPKWTDGGHNGPQCNAALYTLSVCALLLEKQQQCHVGRVPLQVYLEIAGAEVFLLQKGFFAGIYNLETLTLTESLKQPNAV